MRLMLALSAAALLAASAVPTASAQTRLTLLGGGLVPFGDLDDAADPSLAVGLEAEFQPVNALGQRRLLALTASAVYSSLDIDSGYKAALPPGAGTDASLLELNVGVKAYSRVAPFFVAGSAGYSRYDPAGGGKSANGVNIGAGLGFLVPVQIALLQVEGRLHQVFAEDDVSFQYLDVLLGVGLPF